MSRKTDFETAVQELGLRIDEQTGLAYGIVRGIRYCVSMNNSNAVINIVASVQHDGKPPVEEDIKSFAKSSKAIGGAEVDGKRIILTTVAPTLKRSLEKTREAIDELGVYLSTNGYADCCEQCGTTEDINAYIIDEDGHHLCQTCFDGIEQSLANNKLVKSKRKSNLIAGIVGALLGSLIGVAAIVIIGQLGFVAALSGVIMGVCALKGYELLGGKLTTVGIIISCVIMIAMVYFGNCLDWAIFISGELEIGIFESLRAIPVLLEQEMIEASNFYGNVGMLYLFTALGAGPTIMASLHSKDGAYEARRAA